MREGLEAMARAASWVECGSHLAASADGGVEVVPDTLDDEHKPIVALFDAAIAAIRAVTGVAGGGAA